MWFSWWAPGSTGNGYVTTEICLVLFKSSHITTTTLTRLSLSLLSSLLIQEFGQSPKWSSNAKFIIIDSLQPRKRTKHEQRVGSIYLYGDAKNVLGQLTNSLYRKSYSKQRIEKWTQSLLLEKEKKVATLNKQLSLYTNPMSYHTVFGVISKAMDQCCDDIITSKRPILVNEGANTMVM